MKLGIRKPSAKKILKAHTTSKIKRKLKNSVNPIYKKKGMGLIKNPKRSVYNKIYKKATFNIFDLFK